MMYICLQEKRENSTRRLRSYAWRHQNVPWPQVPRENQVKENQKISGNNMSGKVKSLDSYCDHLPSVIRRHRPSSVVRPSSPLNEFSSETSGLIFCKLHGEPYFKWGLKNYTNDHGPLIKMAAMPIHV